MEEEAVITCPYCGETIAVWVDCSAGDRRYTEDCSVCCQPMWLAIDTADARLLYVRAEREND